jgi:hypothetical protein
MKIQLPKTYIHTLESLKKTIQNARLKAVLTANVQLLATYWEIGNAISHQELDRGWGSKVVEQLARDLSIAFPDFKGLSPRNLRYMRNFAIAWPGLSMLRDHDPALDMNSILQQPAAKLPWFHICTLLDKVFSHANSTLTILFWQIGKRINDEILRNKPVEYVKQIVSTLSTQLKSSIWEKL